MSGQKRIRTPIQKERHRLRGDTKFDPMTDKLIEVLLAWGLYDEWIETLDHEQIGRNRNNGHISVGLAIMRRSLISDYGFTPHHAASIMKSQLRENLGPNIRNKYGDNEADFINKIIANQEAIINTYEKIFRTDLSNNRQEMFQIFSNMFNLNISRKLDGKQRRSIESLICLTQKYAIANGNQPEYAKKIEIKQDQSFLSTGAEENYAMEEEKEEIKSLVALDQIDQFLNRELSSPELMDWEDLQYQYHIKQNKFQLI